MSERLTEVSAVTQYLEAIRGIPNSPVSRRSRQMIINDITITEAELGNPLNGLAAIGELHLREKLEMLRASLQEIVGEIDLREAEGNFIKYAKAYAVRHKISYKAWRGYGVKADILTKAGIHQ